MTTPDDNPSPFAGLTVRRAVLLLLAVQLGGWLVFDGMRAFLVGDYVTPQSGPHAGQLGPWRLVFEALGLDARGLVAKSWHVLSGAVFLLAVLLELLGRDRRRLFLLALPFGLWYLPFGTGIALACFLLASRRQA